MTRAAGGRRIGTTRRPTSPSTPVPRTPAQPRIIHAYSTSFGMATRLLGAGASARRSRTSTPWCASPTRSSTARPPRPGLSLADQRELLDALEADTERAMRTGYSANVVVHAFAVTARAVGIGAELTRRSSPRCAGT